MSKNKRNVLTDLMNATPKEVIINKDTFEKSILDPLRGYPIVFSPIFENVILTEFMVSHKTLIDECLLKYGAVLFRGYDISSLQDFQKIVASYDRQVLKYTQRTTPRSEITDKIYTSTDFPNDQIINMHNESSYAAEWPGQIMFFCKTPALLRGETPIADSRRVLQKLSKDTIDKFRRSGVMYVRQLGYGLGLSWQEVFQTTDKKVVEDFCAKGNISFEWLGESVLKMVWIRPAIRQHPSTGEEVWFNHGFFYNIHSYDKDFLEFLDKDELPFNTFYGDGSEIEMSVVEEIKNAYSELNVYFSWQQGDLLLVDNMLMAHGRNSFEGKRETLVAMFG